MSLGVSPRTSRPALARGLAGLGFFRWQVRFRDNGDAARVLLNLRQYKADGTSNNVAIFDSNDYAAAVGYQTRSKCIGVNWDFGDGPYYVDATLTKSAAGGQAALGIIELIPEFCQQ